MTSFTSIAGGFIWTAIASVLMLAAFEPVTMDSKSVAATTVELAAASADQAAS